MENVPIVGEVVKTGPSFWLDAVYKMGVTAAIAIGLVWVLTQDVKEGLKATSLVHSEMMVELKGQNFLASTIQLELASIKRVLIATCVNTAKDNVGRANCIQ